MLEILQALHAAKGTTAQDVPAAEISDAARRIAESLAGGSKVGVFLGNLAQHHPDAGLLHALAQRIADAAGARFGFLGEAANSVGGALAGALPDGSVAGLDAGAMLASPRSAYVLLNVEPELDCHDPSLALAAMRAAKFIVALSPYQHAAVEYAHVMLPIAPFSETSGTFVNTEGRVQSFRGVVNPLAETRPGWKVLRVLGSMLGLDGFAFTTSGEVRAEALRNGDIAARLDNRLREARIGSAKPSQGRLERIGEVLSYHADAIVRRSPALAQTREGQPPVAAMNAGTASELGLRAGGQVRLAQGEGEAIVRLAIDDRLPDGCVRIPAGHALTAALGPLFGAIEVEAMALDERKAV
jgi:NADH-quinone oxidoreductase subunit G